MGQKTGINRERERENYKQQATDKSTEGLVAPISVIYLSEGTELSRASKNNTVRQSQRKQTLFIPSLTLLQYVHNSSRIEADKTGHQIIRKKRWMGMICSTMCAGVFSVLVFLLIQSLI